MEKPNAEIQKLTKDIAAIQARLKTLETAVNGLDTPTSGTQRSENNEESDIEFDILRVLQGKVARIEERLGIDLAD